MSLIHDALLAQDGPALPARPLPRASWWARQSPQARGPVLLAGAGLAGFLLAGTLALAFGRHAQTAQTTHADTPDLAHPASTPAGAIAAGPGVATAPPAPPADVPPAQPQPPVRDAAPAPQAPEPPALPAIARQAENSRPAAATDAGGNAEPLPVAAAPRAPLPTATPAVAGNDAAPAPIRIKVEHRTGNAPADTGMENRAVEQAVGEVESAMARADLPAAQQALARLDALLPPESLTLLRMQAWIAHAGNDTARAETLYRRIAERVPDDVNAGVNIALLDARHGDADAARQRLARLSSRYPRSPQVTRALAELDSIAP